MNQHAIKTVGDFLTLYDSFIKNLTCFNLKKYSYKLQIKYYKGKWKQTPRPEGKIPKKRWKY